MTFNKILIKNIVQDKIEELKQSTIDSAARKRTAQLRDPKFKGEEVPIYKAGTKEQIGTRRKPGKGVIQLRLQGRKESPGKPAVKPLYKNITPGATGRAARQDASHQPVYDRMAELLIERNLFKDLYSLGKGVGKVGKGVYRGIRGITRLGGGMFNLAKKAGGAVKSAYSSAMKPSQDLSQSIARSTVKRNMELDSELEQENELQKQARAKQKQDLMAAQKNAETENQRVKNLNKLKSKVTRAPGQEDKRARKIAVMKALADREQEKSRKLVNYESISYRDLMLQKIAEGIIHDRGLSDDRVDELIQFIPAILRGAQLTRGGMQVYRALKGANNLRKIYGATRAAYAANRAAGMGSAFKGAASAGLRKAIPHLAKGFLTGEIEDATNAFVKGVKQRVAGDFIGKGIGKAAKTASTVQKYTGGNKSSKPKQEPKDTSYEPSHTNMDDYRGYPKVGDDDDDQ